MHVYGLEEWSMSIQAPPAFWHAFLEHVSSQIFDHGFVHRWCDWAVHAPWSVGGQPCFVLALVWYCAAEHVRRDEQTRLLVALGAFVWYVLVPQVVSAVHTRLLVAVGALD
jgi:hypothetical protein